MARYYDTLGNIVDTIKGANGKSRSPNVSDVRKRVNNPKEALLPSVTTVLKVIANDWLVEWKVKEVLKKAFAYAKSMDNEKSFVDTIMKEFNDDSDKTMDEGKDIHKAVELALKGEEYDQKYAVHVKNTLAKLEGCYGNLTSELPLAFVTQQSNGKFHGYGGTVDIFIDPTGFPLGIEIPGKGKLIEAKGMVVDIKTVSKHPDKPHDSWIIQTSAYAYAIADGYGRMKTPDSASRVLEGREFKVEGVLPLSEAQHEMATAIITIERESGDVRWHDISKEDMYWGYKTFNSAMSLWITKNGIA